MKKVLVCFVLLLVLTLSGCPNDSKESAVDKPRQDVVAKGVAINDVLGPDLSGFEETLNVTILHIDGVVIPKWCFFAVPEEPGWYCSVLSVVAPNGKMDEGTRRLTLYESLGRQENGEAFREYKIKDSAKQKKYLQIAESYLKQECKWTPADFRIIF